ncbi:MAG: MAPEG family protein [Salinisphaeraceae bacterium]
MAIVSVYAALLALLFIALSINVIRVRRATNTALGDAGDARLLRAMRVHANFAEYVPLALILLFAAAGLGAGTIWLHLLGALLLAGRLSHAWGVARTPENLRFRMVGMMTTFLALAATALTLLALALGGAIT